MLWCWMSVIWPMPMCWYAEMSLFLGDSPVTSPVVCRCSTCKCSQIHRPFIILLLAKMVHISIDENCLRTWRRFLYLLSQMDCSVYRIILPSNIKTIHVSHVLHRNKRLQLSFDWQCTIVWLSSLDAWWPSGKDA